MYIYLADLPMAVIDTSAELQGEASPLRDIQVIVGQWLGETAKLAYLHVNHLHAPELATDAQGGVVWQASYAAFGRVTAQASDFKLSLRLPGQYEDAGTGLHYNRQRYCDPSRGSYLTPDPLGTPDGPNGYAYVNHNPLKYIDPDGLVLFAFDGTGNDLSSQTNVQHFANAYRDYSEYDNANSIRGMSFYRRGPGTSAGDWTDGPAVGGAVAYRLRDIVEGQVLDFNNYVAGRVRWEVDRARTSANPVSRDNPVDIYLDIVGFSRGAAAAREFMNRINDNTRTGFYREAAGGACARVFIRFAGLFDTVLGTNLDFTMRMAIPAAVQQVAHAVAVNEHRGLFPLESIEESYSNPGFSSNRIERGFIGAHSDVGGGYTVIDGGDLSDVALNWMMRQATGAGLTMAALNDQLRTVSNPIVHDPRRETTWRALDDAMATGDRAVRYRNASDGPMLGFSPMSRNAPIQGMTAAEAERLRLIQWRNLGITQITETQVGDVNIREYSTWLNSNFGMNWQ
jgi:RHS repeat-associated protein